ncbi:hypothetical protein EXIGLDRAFT_693421 [Exidia glandulosa HHB12029]|uniref:Uncharacterized protein n=1 Tax=Exidia glandulosa HHB12029 TaxID=1314781 RepID=A0A165NVU4_EXIGL|nr:hypothetical protein EXIGLDRAFT_693421 [Exidia glandulosa HHB12029]
MHFKGAYQTARASKVPPRSLQGFLRSMVLFALLGSDHTCNVLALFTVQVFALFAAAPPYDPGVSNTAPDGTVRLSTSELLAAPGKPGCSRGLVSRMKLADKMVLYWVGGMARQSGMIRPAVDAEAGSSE